MMLKRVLDKLVTALVLAWGSELLRAGLDFDQLCQVIGCYIFIPWV